MHCKKYESFFYAEYGLSLMICDAGMLNDFNKTMVFTDLEKMYSNIHDM